MSHPSADISVDVLIVGAGPIGLNLAYQLRHFSLPPLARSSSSKETSTKPSSINPRSTKSGSTKPNGISVHIIESLPKPTQEAFGRAVTFWPRSIEMLSQLGLGDPILQQCTAVRSSSAYDPAGNEVFGRGWSFVEGITDTRYAFASVLRQKYVEDIFRSKLDALGVQVAENHKFQSLEISHKIPPGEMGRVRATIIDTTDTEYTVSCRYLLGCDGSRTTVRSAAGISSTGSRTEDKWVRVDGVLKHTTMPKPHTYGSLESPMYGNVLWVPLDHGATRIGFALPKKYAGGELGKDELASEALLAIAPFEGEWEQVDWASIYSVGQRLADTFWTDECVFLAGDAAHSHSSGAGQGMNAGTHDAVNLGWKLAMVLTGILKPHILKTYDLERRPNAARLIRYDEGISTLITGRLPEGWKGSAEPNVALGELLGEAKGFNTGLTIGYEGPGNCAVWNNKAEAPATTIPAPVAPGFRAPDVQILRPALWTTVWLQEITPNMAKFYVLVFVGRTEESRANFCDFKKDLAKSKRFQTEPLGDTSEGLWPVDFITVLPRKANNAWNELGTTPLGSVYFDTDDGCAGRRYGVDPGGRVFVLRPDGFIGARFPLEVQSALDIRSYLGGLLN